MEVGIEDRVNREQTNKIQRKRDQIANQESAYPTAFPPKQEDSDRPPVEDSERRPSKQHRHAVAEPSAQILQGKQEWKGSGYRATRKADSIASVPMWMTHPPLVRSFDLPAFGFGGFYKRGCQEKTLLPAPEPSYFSCIQPLSSAPVLSVRSSSGVSFPCYCILRWLKLHKPNGGPVQRANHGSI